MTGPNLFLLHKPYGVLSHFTSREGHRTLAGFGPFPPTVYPVGRLDLDSEGLLLLTDDANLQHRLTTPRFAHRRSYWVQIDGIPRDDELLALAKGVRIGGELTRPAVVGIMDAAPPLPDRDPPVRFRKNIPTSWIDLALTEGKNRQIRRMTAAVGHPTLRLIRYRIENLDIGGLKPGDSRRATDGETAELMGIVGRPQVRDENKNPGAPTRRRGQGG